MTIHPEHPFETPLADRSEVRRWRGRLAAPVTVVAAGSGSKRAGLTVSSIQLVEGERDHVVMWLDPESDLAESLSVGASLTITQLAKGDEFTAEAFAGLAPAPGGPFQLNDWTDGKWGPELPHRSMLGASVTSIASLGWFTQVTAVIEKVTVVELAALTHLRGRFVTY